MMYHRGVRFHSWTWVGAAGLVLAGCGPAGPSSLEGGGVGEGETVGDGDGDPTGDGDGDGECTIEGSLGSQPQFYFEEQVRVELGDDFVGYCADIGIGDYAVSWTAPYSGPFRVYVYGDVGTFMAMLRGDCTGELEGCAWFDSPSVDFEAVEGQQYTFVVDGDVEGWFELELVPLDITNVCPYGQLFGFQDSVSGSSVGSDFQFSSICGGEDAPDRGYLFIPEQSGVYRIDTVGSTFDTVLHVFAGECENGSELACNDDEVGFGNQSVIDLWLDAGQIYTIVVDGYAGDAGSYHLNLQYIGEEQTICDDIDDVLDEFPVFVSWPVEDTIDDVFQECSSYPNERRFIWIPPQDGEYVLRQGADGNPHAFARLNGCDANGQSCEGSGDGSNNLQTVFSATAGHEQVIISEWEAVVPGDVTLTIDLFDENAGCGEDLGSQIPTIVADTTVGSGDEYGGSCASNPAPERELHWTAPETGTYRFSLEGSDFDTLLYIRDGGCGGPELGCNDDTLTQQWSSLELALDAGQMVSIFVDGNGGAGDFTLEIAQI
jgi:hypothetical protein